MSSNLGEHSIHMLDPPLTENPLTLRLAVRVENNPKGARSTTQSVPQEHLHGWPSSCIRDCVQFSSGSVLT
jgi:hypothetical protein